MTKKILLVLALVIAISCKKDNSDDSIKQENGNIWISGGLYYCAEQIHLDNCDILTTHRGGLLSFKSGDRVNVKYKEIGANENCSSYIDCEIIEINKIE